MRSLRLKRKCIAFTLLEVLIALAIFAVAIVGFLTASEQNIENAAYLENRMIALWLAENKINEVRLLGKEQVRNSESFERYVGREWEVTTKVSNGEWFGTKKVVIEIRLSNAREDASPYVLTAYL